ncbi:MAG: HAMP domain-containing histidine kinase [Acetatifactor sp.]|nr:HAMP domain-containing histidine kinase [Acetatifactor sp.]
MNKVSLKRFGLELLEHLIAGAILIAVAAMLFNSHISVRSISEEAHTYTFDPLNTDSLFEDTQVFHDILYTAVADITSLAVFREEMEINGGFRPDKRISVTEYAAKVDPANDCSVTAIYELDDLINWGKFGVEYNNRSFSISDFVNYFRPATAPENFALDENGELYFVGFLTGEESETAQEPSFSEEFLTVYESYTEEQLEDMVYYDIMAQFPAGELNVVREEDGTFLVYVPMLICRYGTVDGVQQLSTYADNWVDYLQLQDNLVLAIEKLTSHYQQYVTGMELYAEGSSNIKYVIRRMEEDGQTITYTNDADRAYYSDNELADYFYSEFHKYFVYYPDTLEFTGNAGLTEADLYSFMNDEYAYAYQGDTHIWMGVDTGYPVEGDAFYNAHVVFERIVPNSTQIVLLIAVMVLIWLGLGIYLTADTGVFYDEEGERLYHLNAFDHIWTEIMLLAGVGLYYLARRGIIFLMDVANAVYNSHTEMMGMSLDRLYEYGTFGLYGFLASLSLGIVWFSLVRRLRARSLWKDSFCHWILQCLRKATNFVFYHRNAAISILVSYNLFLLINLLGLFLAWILRERGDWATASIVLAMVVFDGTIGVILFRHGAGQTDIVDGINRIRNGEVDYKLDLDTLSGVNREMADAVNNIGEGIRKAVDTSMRDEQMKSDLITNVSHDIKTPLTSIVNYVDLLGRLDIQEEPAKSYIAVLDSKAQRLKQLTDDLVEASKISSGNIVLNTEKLNFTELLNQTIGEFSEKLKERKLSVVFEDANIPAWIYADSRRMWRIVENLFYNICKYALEGTRVYLEMTVEDGQIEASIKNISERQMNMRGDELTERFIRGDSSRTTEGSGLGLFIAKSLTQVQGGTFEIQLDGDLFKVVLTFPEYQELEKDET